MADIPHLSFPYEFGVHNEQDTIDDITACVAAVLSCPQGFRNEEPTFGITDQAFRQGGASLPELRSAVSRWEPRAQTQADQIIDAATAYVDIEVKERA